MPKIELSANDTPRVTVIAATAAAKDFQVRDGSCFFATENPGADLDAGFERLARSTGADWQVGPNKTVYLWTTTRALVFYGELV